MRLRRLDTCRRRVAHAGEHFEFNVLGPLEVRRDGELLELGGARQRALLAFLLLHRNQVVTRERLIDALWGERPPATAANALQVAVHGLRKLLGHDRLRSHAAAATSSSSTPGSSTSTTFERAVERARAGSHVGERVRPLSLWRGRRRDLRVPGRSARRARAPRRIYGSSCSRSGSRPTSAPAGMRRSWRGARDTRRGAPVPGTPARAADGRPLPGGSPGRRPRGVRAGATDIRRRARDRARARASESSSSGFSARIRSRSAGAGIGAGRRSAGTADVSRRPPAGDRQPSPACCGCPTCAW